MPDPTSALIHYDAANGQAIGEIPDSAGELQGYAIQQPPGLCPPALWGRDYRKLDGPRQGTVYQCRLWPGDVWTCTCPDWQYRHRQHRGARERGAPCKHLAAAQALRQLLTRL